jgi:serine phosphatase RsbU (regulator of sigma subunit)
VWALSTRLCEESSEKTLRLRCVWVFDPRGRQRGVGDPAARAVGAQKCTIAGEDPAYAAGSGVRAHTTIPLVGVFDDQHHLFQQASIYVEAGTLFIAATDGVTEARSPSGEFFGMDRFVEVAAANRALSEPELAQAIVDAVLNFCENDRRDDIAVVAARFL